MIQLQIEISVYLLSICNAQTISPFEPNWKNALSVQIPSNYVCVDTCDMFV